MGRKRSHFISRLCIYTFTEKIKQNVGGVNSELAAKFSRAGHAITEAHSTFSHIYMCINIWPYTYKPQARHRIIFFRYLSISWIILGRGLRIKKALI